MYTLQEFFEEVPSDHALFYLHDDKPVLALVKTFEQVTIDYG